MIRDAVRTGTRQVRSRQSAIRSFASPSRVRGTRRRIDVRAGRRSTTETGISPTWSPARSAPQDQLGVEQVLAEAARARPLDRSPLHRLHAVRV
jgi:hypothetical protein